MNEKNHKVVTYSFLCVKENQYVYISQIQDLALQIIFILTPDNKVCVHSKPTGLYFVYCNWKGKSILLFFV